MSLDTTKIAEILAAEMAALTPVSMMLLGDDRAIRHLESQIEKIEEQLVELRSEAASRLAYIGAHLTGLRDRLYLLIDGIKDDNDPTIAELQAVIELLDSLGVGRKRRGRGGGRFDIDAEQLAEIGDRLALPSGADQAEAAQ
jgi:hypothetical protein